MLTTCWSIFVCCLLFVVVVVVGRKERSPHSIYTNSRSTALRLLLVIIITSVLLSIYIDNEAEKAMSQAGIGRSFGFLLAALKYIAERQSVEALAIEAGLVQAWHCWHGRHG